MDKVDWDNLEGRPQLESVHHEGFELRAGDRVRLWPKSGRDIMDITLKGKVAMIESIEQDYEEKIHLAIVVEDDPGRDLGLLRQTGHRFFYSLDEIEPIDAAKIPDVTTNDE